MTSTQPVEGTEYDRLLTEALPKLNLTLDSQLLSEFRGGEQFIGAADVLRMCVERGIHLSDEALEDIEADAIDSLDDEWHTYRHYAAQISENIAVIRANRAG